MTLAPKGHDPRAGLTGRSFEISLEDYEKYGGMHLTGALPVGGCSLHLAPVAFSGGRRVTGPVASIEYAGMLRLQYAVRIGRDPGGFPTTATVAVRSEYELPGSPAFVLVNNPQRMPLSVHDGNPVDVAPLDAQGQLADHPSKYLRWTAATASGAGELWAANVSGLHGWIRLFLNITDPLQLRTIALTVALSTLAVTVIGGYVVTSVRDNLFDQNRDQVIAQANRAIAAAQEEFTQASDSGTTDDLELVQISAFRSIAAIISADVMVCACTRASLRRRRFCDGSRGKTRSTEA